MGIGSHGGSAAAAQPRPWLRGLRIASPAVPLHAHLWSTLPRLQHALRPRPAPEAVPWECFLDDPQVGRIRLNGRFRREADPRAALLLLHGLGGTADSHYMLRMARAAHQAGLTCLRLNLRGSDRQGEDFYHAGLTADVHAALAAPELAGYDDLFLAGYSLGGHVALRAATEEGDPRLRAAVAVCSPLDLSLGQRLIDRPGSWIYRHYLLRALNAIYAGVAARRPVPYPLEAALRIRTIREWDDRIVAPRHGFAGAADYYARMSVAGRLDRLRIPALLLNAEHDPMVSSQDVRPLAQAPRLTARFLPQGGHVGFPARIDAGLARNGETAPGPPFAGGIEAQLLAWLRARAAA